MPDIHFECPKCGQPLDAPDELVNQLIECPDCKEMISVPPYSRRMKPPNPPEPVPKLASTAPPSAPAPIYDKLPEVESSGVASALTFFAVLEFIGAVIGGLVVGVGDGYNGNAEFGWLIFVCGVLSGLILLGFARVIEYSFQSAQRLRRIEILIWKSYNDKNRSNT